MIVRRALLIIVALLVVLLAGGVALLAGGKLDSTLNSVLPKGWKITAMSAVDLSLESATLPRFSLSYQDCPLLDIEQLRLEWWERRQIRIPTSTIDYRCLSLLPQTEPSSGESNDFSPLLALLPESSVEIQALQWRNLPADMPARLKALLDSPSQLHVAFFQQKLTASIKQKALDLHGSLQDNRVQLDGIYQPNQQEQHHFRLNGILGERFDEFPPNAEVEYEWNVPKSLITLPDLQRGKAKLSWQKENELFRGDLHLQSAKQTDNQLTVPFSFDQKTLSIEQAKVAWNGLPNFPLNAFVSAKFTPNSVDKNNLFPIKTALRVSLLSQNAKGKGNIVINSPEGKIEPLQLHLPFQIHGNVKYDDFILYSAVPLELSGQFDALKLRFLPSALLRLTGKARLLTIDDLRFPLAGVQVDKHGITGRLHAIFRGESPDFKNIELHLDGYAKNFKAGALRFFQTAKVKKSEQDQWNWRLWGNSSFNRLNSKLKVAGRGNWHKNLVQLSEFQGEIDKIQQHGVFIPKTELTLQEPIKFAYETFHLDGAVRLKSNKVAFDYGGELEQPTVDLQFSGETEKLGLKGEVKANQLGPIRLFASRQLTEKASNLIGRLYWIEQPSNVFQSLFPFRNQWVITSGTIKGETAFSVNADRGLIAGGHFSIRNGGVSFPNGEMKGIDFSLPYQFRQDRFHLGTKQAVEVNIDEVNVGLPISNVRVKVQGSYPYTKQHPLRLRQLSLNLLDGSLDVEHFALPQTEIAQLNLRRINFEKMLDLAQYHQIKLSGRANALFPFWLSGKPCYICGGRIEQAETSYLKFTPELMNAIQKAGYTERILSYTVNDSRLNTLTANVDVATNGEMKLRANIRSQLIEHEKTKINLNYNHTENLFDLWKSINYGSQFEQQIEHSIYKQLDGK